MNAAITAERLNRDCHCVTTDFTRLQDNLPRTHPNLFSPSPVFVAPEHVAQMVELIRAIERTVQQEVFRNRVLRGADPIVLRDPGMRGAFLGFDFHISSDGPRLIEINTNAGGALINIAARRAQQPCCTDMARAPDGADSAELLEHRIVEMFRNEWRLAGGATPLRKVALIDDHPRDQYLYPEFLLFRELFGRHGIDVDILDPAAAPGANFDLVYNRLTDFYLQEPSHAALRQAYLDGALVTPHPRAHALYANKRNLALLSDASELRRLGIPEEDTSTLTRLIPRTRVVEGESEAWWKDRKRWFFKPAHGFGSRGAYRGDKLTRGAFEALMKDEYVAQEFVPAGVRHTVDGRDPLKVDIRCYAYDGEVLLIAARLYQGQTTNMRTAGGGFAVVYSCQPREIA